MQTLTYEERRDYSAAESQIAVMVFANEDCTDVEFVALKPRPDDEAMAALKYQWAGRGLKTLGVMGLNGTTPLCAFKVALDPEKINTLARAFLARVNAALFSALTEHMEITELHRLATLSGDMLPN